MKQSRAAIRYAKAMYSLSEENDSSDLVYNDMLFFISFSISDLDFNQMLLSSVVKSNDKKKIISSLLKTSTKITNDLITLLGVNNRLTIFIDIAQSFRQLYELNNNMSKVLVVTALPMTQQIKERVLSKINQITKKNTVIENRIDKSILGGFILRYEDKEYNASLLNKLNSIKKELV